MVMAMIVSSGGSTFTHLHANVPDENIAEMTRLYSIRRNMNVPFGERIGLVLDLSRAAAARGDASPRPCGMFK
jgi:hypothetical protein